MAEDSTQYLGVRSREFGSRILGGGSLGTKRRVKKEVKTKIRSDLAEVLLPLGVHHGLSSPLVADRNELGHDGEGDLTGTASAQVETDGSVTARDFLALDAVALQSPQDLLDLGHAADEP